MVNGPIISFFISTHLYNFFPLILVRHTVTGLVQDPLAVVNLDNRLYMHNMTKLKEIKRLSTLRSTYLLIVTFCNNMGNTHLPVIELK